MSHDGWDTTIRASGYPYGWWGENVAYGYTTADSVMAAWMNSPGHRANILERQLPRPRRRLRLQRQPRALLDTGLRSPRVTTPSVSPFSSRPPDDLRGASPFVRQRMRCRCRIANSGLASVPV